MSDYEKKFLRLLLPIVVAGAAWADQPTGTFLTPSKHTATLGETLTLRFDSGAAKDARPIAWPRGEVDWLFVRGGRDQTNHHDVQPQRAGDNSVPLTIEHAGVTLVGIDRKPVIVEMPRTELRALLGAVGKPAGPPAAVRVDEAKLRVRRVESAKTLIRVPDPDGVLRPSAIATSKSGQAVEIRPLFDPSAAPVDTDVPLWVYIAGSKKGGLKVQATNVTAGTTTTFITDRGGSGHFRVDAAGQWRIEVHDCQPLKDDPAADWVIYSATLTFEVVGKGAQP